MTMKRYTVIDNKTNHRGDYNWLEWNVAWWLVFALGVLTGAMIF